jgi:hypothetical protein
LAFIILAWFFQIKSTEDLEFHVKFKIKYYEKENVSFSSDVVDGCWVNNNRICKPESTGS